jgi:hypothetical protein|eukprot:2889560-Prymnesium_polylepis.2
MDCTKPPTEDAVEKLLAAAKAETETRKAPSWLLVTDKEGNMLAEKACSTAMLKKTAPWR